jgi:hypothetical protein
LMRNSRNADIQKRLPRFQHITHYRTETHNTKRAGDYSQLCVIVASSGRHTPQATSQIILLKMTVDLTGI